MHLDFVGRTSDAKERLIEAVQELIWRGSYGTTTIDLICERAGVKKGSFYYFFESKTDLAVAALEAKGKVKRVELDRIFSASVSGLDRLLNYCDLVYADQVAQQKCCGRILGCPMFSMGSEVCTNEPALGLKIREMLAGWTQYLETAVRDAQAAGQVQVADVGAAARMLLAFYEGVMTQSRILNDPEVLKQMKDGTRVILGVGR